LGVTLTGTRDGQCFQCAAHRSTALRTDSVPTHLPAAHALQKKRLVRISPRCIRRAIAATRCDNAPRAMHTRGVGESCFTSTTAFAAVEVRLGSSQVRAWCTPGSRRPVRGAQFALSSR
jgi:hypothetical protein